jgi:hypothetical protein
MIKMSVWAILRRGLYFGYFVDKSIDTVDRRRNRWDIGPMYAVDLLFVCIQIVPCCNGQRGGADLSAQECLGVAVMWMSDQAKFAAHPSETEWTATLMIYKTIRYRSKIIRTGRIIQIEPNMDTTHWIGMSRFTAQRLA